MFRTQSLYLFLSSVINFSILALIICNDFQGKSFGFYTIIYIISSNLLLYLIFLHKKKNLQLKLLISFSLIYFFFTLYFLIIVYASEYYFFALTGFSHILNILAIKNIRKDIELLSSVDRLR